MLASLPSVHFHPAACSAGRTPAWPTLARGHARAHWVCRRPGCLCRVLSGPGVLGCRAAEPAHNQGEAGFSLLPGRPGSAPVRHGLCGCPSLSFLRPLTLLPGAVSTRKHRAPGTDVHTFPPRHPRQSPLPTVTGSRPTPSSLWGVLPLMSSRVATSPGAGTSAVSLGVQSVCRETQSSALVRGLSQCCCLRIVGPGLEERGVDRKVTSPLVGETDLCGWILPWKNVKCMCNI